MRENALVRAWVKRGGRLELAEVAAPSPRSDELVVEVRAVSLNRGEVRAASHAREGAIPGWDVAGVVVAAAPNGQGPPAGARVAALLGAGAWAERACVPAGIAAVVPEPVELAVAATLPIAGLTVVRALAVAGSLLGREVLVTGGSGGVGQLAIQLAALAGATVTAISSTPARHDTLRELGARHVVGAIEQAPGAYDLVLESVGGESLAHDVTRAASGGVVVTIGNSAEQDTTFNARTLYAKGGASIYGLLVFEELASRRVTARDLERLLALVAAGRLRPSIAQQRSWTELPAVLAELETRAFAGKAVLTVD